jgi:hypothetical protein
MSGYPPQAFPSYPLEHVDQYSPTLRPDILPKDPKALAGYVRVIATEAAIYGMPCVLQYREMFRQAVDVDDPRYVGFHRFQHDRELAGPGYQAFKSPNSDTLYSNAWLDLSRGPLLVEVPAVALRYYTLNFLDMYANASNISTRTHGNQGGRYLVVPSSWKGDAPKGVKLFRVATPYAWILLRVFAQTPEEVGLARSFQDGVRLTPVQPASAPSNWPAADVWDAAHYFRILDHVLRTNGAPMQEDALLYRFRAIGVGGDLPYDHDGLAPVVRGAIEAGFDDAMQIVSSSRAQLGISTGTGWNKVDKARYGFNYLSRAVTNYVGLGANVEEENYSFNTFFDSDGIALDGTSSTYTLAIQPPPVDAFWSVTLYEAKNFELYPNEIDRYLINDRSELPAGDGANKHMIVIQHQRPADTTGWLPAPAGPFFLVFRAYLPKAEMLAGQWRPEPVQNSR